MNRLWLFLFLFVASVSCLADEIREGKIFGSAGPFINMILPQYSQDTANFPLMFGLGGLVEADLSANGGVEIGLFYFRKTYQRVLGTSHIVERIDKISIPLGYRYWFFDRLSLGLFFTSAFSVGDYQTILDTTGGSIYTSAREVSELGWEVSVQWQIWKEDRLSFILDGRYHYSITAKFSEDANLFGLLLGVKYQR